MLLRHERARLRKQKKQDAIDDRERLGEVVGPPGTRDDSTGRIAAEGLHHARLKVGAHGILKPRAILDERRRATRPPSSAVTNAGNERGSSASGSLKSTLRRIEWPRRSTTDTNGGARSRHHVASSACFSPRQTRDGRVAHGARTSRTGPLADSSRAVAMTIVELRVVGAKTQLRRQRHRDAIEQRTESRGRTAMAFDVRPP